MSYSTLRAQTQPESKVRSTDTINIVVRRNGKFVARADKNFLMYTSLIRKSPPSIVVSIHFSLRRHKDLNSTIKITSLG